jgi:hypothetical protein
VKLIQIRFISLISEKNFLAIRAHLNSYIKACRRRPRVDRALKKNIRIADNHAKKLSEASVSLK